jgi:hypothetical protein
MKRLICFLFHWRRQCRNADTRYYAWQCGICGERWLTPRKSPHGQSGA